MKFLNVGIDMGLGVVKSDLRREVMELNEEHTTNNIAVGVMKTVIPPPVRLCSLRLF